MMPFVAGLFRSLSYLGALWFGLIVGLQVDSGGFSPTRMEGLLVFGVTVLLGSAATVLAKIHRINKGCGDKP